MGKHRHTKDRLFISTTEHKHEWGGKRDPTKAPISRLPFNCCALSLLPFENPVCTRDGLIFDILNVIPYVKKFKKNPINGEPLKMTDLIQLNFHKNAQGEYHDPISFKVFTEYSHIVAIRTSGNVYSYETVEELNRKPKFWKDLLTNEDFTLKDIITIQDPTNFEKRTVGNFDYVRQQIDIDLLKKEMANQAPDLETINHFSLGKKILEELREKYSKKEEEKKSEAPAPRKQQKTSEDDEFVPLNYVKELQASGKMMHSRFTSGNAASSFTSTMSDLSYDNSLRKLTDDEVRKVYYEPIKMEQKKGYVQIITSIGAVNVELFANFVPKTCENFIELCEKKYYNNTKFHRLIKNFMVQGGDPTGSGRGGESIYGSPFEDEFHAKLSHDSAGMLSMANAGKNTNKSQFFITLGACKHLDNKHSVFGRLMGDSRILDIINELKTDERDRPLIDLVILDTLIVTNPFRDMIKRLKQQENAAKEAAKETAKTSENDADRWISTKKTSILPAITELKSGAQDQSTLPKAANTQPKDPKQSKSNAFSFGNW